MDDLISRQAATGHDYSDGFVDGYKQGQKDAECKTGEWIKHEIGHENVPWGFDCSECGAWFVIGQEIIKRYKHCPHCGAKMEVEHEL